MGELNVNYVVAGNHKTYWSLNGQTNQEENDHEEADTLMIRCLKLGSDSVHTNVVSVYFADTKFTKRRLEGEKLPPTKDAFGFHLSRAFFQLSIWSSACTDATANNLDPLHHGWQMENGILTGIMTEQNIAPIEVMELVAC